MLLLGFNRILHDCLADALQRGNHARVIDRASRKRPDMAVINVGGHPENALGQIRRVAESFPEAKLVIYGIDGEEHVVPYVEAGAHGYVPATASLSELCEIIGATTRNEMPVSSETAFAMFRRLSEVSGLRRHTSVLDSLVLSGRELEVLRLIADGLANREIADRLLLSFHTVKNHIQNIFEKLGVKRRIDAVEHARQRGWLVGAAECVKCPC